jgi:hypothetical protein
MAHGMTECQLLTLPGDLPPDVLLNPVKPAQMAMATQLLFGKPF